MQQFRNYKILPLFLAGIMVLFSSCGVTEQVGERIVEEAAEQIAGEGAIETAEAFTAAAATEVAALATSESGAGASAESGSDVVDVTFDDEPSDPADSEQNDANSGADAGMGDDPLPVEPASKLPGTLTGFQNGGDMFDVYQFQARAQQIVRVTVSNAAKNSSAIFFDLGNSDGYDTSRMVMPGESAELVMGSSNEAFYQFEVSHNGESDTAVYSFDLVIVDENDANTAADAPDTLESAMMIDAAITYQGASIGNETGANNFDCYQVELPTAGGSVTVDLSVPTDQPNETYVRGELYDASGELLTSNTAEYGSAITLAFGAESYEEASVGMYRFCLESYSNYAYGEYEFVVTLGESSN